MWWFDTQICCKILPKYGTYPLPQKLSWVCVCVCVCVCLCVVRTSKIYSLKNFQVHNMVLLNIIIMLNVRSLEIIHLNHWKRDHLHPFPLCFPGDSLVKNLPANAGEESSITGSGRSPGEGNGYPLQYLAWKIPWTGWAAVHGVAKSRAWLSD